MVEWSKDHVAAIGSQTQHFGLVDGTWTNSRPCRALSRKWRQLVGKVGEWYVASQHLQGYSPRLRQLSTDGLAPASKYWMYRLHVGVYGPNKPSSQLSTDVWLSPMLHWLARERNWVQTHGSVSRCAVDCVGVPFSQEQWLYPTLSVTRQGLLYIDHVRYVWSRTICGLSVECMWIVGRIFPCRVYIDSNHRDSRIWVTACLLQSSCRLLNDMVYVLIWICDSLL
jgi:hypothetical protein